MRNYHTRRESEGIKNDPVRRAKIVSLYRDHGVSKKDVADRFGVSLTTIETILKEDTRA